MSEWKSIKGGWDEETGVAVYHVTKGSTSLCQSDHDELDTLLAGWVSVDERLPPKSHDPILLWNGRWAYVGKYLDTLKDGPRFHNPHDDVLPRNITMWMPIEIPTN